MKQAKKSTKDKNVSAEIISNVQNIFFIQMDFLFRTLIVSTNRNVFNCEQQKSNKEKMQFLRFLDYYPVHFQKYQLPLKLSNWTEIYENPQNSTKNSYSMAEYFKWITFTKRDRFQGYLAFCWRLWKFRWQFLFGFLFVCTCIPNGSVILNSIHNWLLKRILNQL